MGGYAKGQEEGDARGPTQQMMRWRGEMVRPVGAGDSVCGVRRAM